MKNIFYLLTLSLIFHQPYAQEPKNLMDAEGLKVGSKAPDFQAVDQEERTFRLRSALEKGPVVMIFYRGHWCPVCNKHLSGIQDSLRLITAKGVTVIAISPQKPEYLQKMSEKTGAEFSLLYDEDYKIAASYNVSFTPETKELIIYNTMLNAQLKKSQSDDSQRLPIPATYIINQEGTIIWRQFDPDYKNRSSIKEILSNIPN